MQDFPCFRIFNMLINSMSIMRERINFFLENSIQFADQFTSFPAM